MYGLTLVAEETLQSDVAMLNNFGMSSSESEEEEELEVQYWRKERHFREMYLESIQVSF